MNKLFFFIWAAVLIAFIGCSSADDSPVSPTDKHADIVDSFAIIDVSMHGDRLNAIGLMGAYELIINPDTMTAEIIAKRNASIGEGYIVSGISFFSMWPCTDCLKISSISLDDDHNIVLGMSITHPFPEGDMFKPPTAMNRRDLDIFDVALLVAPQDVTPDIFTLTGASAYSGICVNPDGYTTELANVIGDQSALPYFLVIDDSKTGESTFNKFEMESSETFEARFEFTKVDEFRFDLYLTFGYGFSARRPQRLEPKYYNPEFNRKAAWKVEVIPPGPAERGSTWDDDDSDTPYDVEVHVYNWQQGATVYNDPADFENAPHDNIYAASDVASVSVEIPGMTNTIPIETDPISGTGMPDDPLVYIISLANENLLEEGQYYGLVKVTDQRSPGVIGDRDFLIDTPDGIELNNYDLPEYATYQVFPATVVTGRLRPVAIASIVGRDTTLEGTGITFDASESYHPEYPDAWIVAYEWDFNGDGVYGDPHEGDPENPTHFYSTVGQYQVQLRVRDNFGGTGYLDEPLTVNIISRFNIPTGRDGVEIHDIAARHTDETIMILFNDRQVWKYDLFMRNGEYFFTALGKNTDYKMMDVTTNGWIFYNYVDPNSYAMTTWYEPDGTHHCDYAGNQSSPYYRLAYTIGERYGIIYQNHPPVANRGQHIRLDTQAFGGACWALFNQPEGWPDDHVTMTSRQVRAHGQYVNSHSGLRWYLDPPTYRVRLYGWAMTWQGVDMGTFGDAGDQFNAPTDITVKSDDETIFVTDVKSNGDRVVKMWNGIAGTFYREFGNNNQMADDPKFCDILTTTDYLYVAMENTVSIFIPDDFED